MRVLISRRLRSTSARSASIERDWSSAAISRVLAMAAAAWSASERTRAIWAASKASVRRLNVPSAPYTSSPARSGATTIEWIPMSATTWSGPSAWGKDVSLG